MAFKMKGWGGYQSSPLQRKSRKGTQVINGVLCDAYGRPIDPKKAHEADTVNNYKGPGTKNDSDKVDRGLGPAFKYTDPTKKKKGKYITKDGKKYWQAPDGSLHTGQVSDYEQEKENDKKLLEQEKARRAKAKAKSKTKKVKNTSKDKAVKDKDYQNKKEALLNKGFTQKDADWMIKHGGE